MKQLSKRLLPVLLLFVLHACKVSSPTITPSPVSTQQDTIPAPPVYVTQKGDTLDSLLMPIDISIHRLLPDTVLIRGVGDIMMGTQYPSTSYLPGGNGEYLWDDVRELLLSADITFGNLEGTVLDGEGDPKECANPKACYLFKMPVRFTPNLLQNGFDLLSLANNHANDFGEPGRMSTLSVLDSIGIAVAGSVERPYSITTIGHLKVGFIAFAPNKGTLGFYDVAYASSLVAHLDSLSDLVVVSIHGGAEGADNMHVTRQTEYYYGENRGDIYNFSHRMVDVGADIIFGHGPHVVRGVEVYNDRLIAYSLGNFLTYGRFNLKGPAGQAPLIEVKTDATGKFLEGKVHSFKQSYTYGPQVDPTGSAMKTMRSLSDEDFPENPIKIDEEGRIIYIQN